MRDEEFACGWKFGVCKFLYIKNSDIIEHASNKVLVFGKGYPVSRS